MSAPLKLLELAERGRAATAPQPAIAPRDDDARARSARAIARYRAENPPGSIDRNDVCPACDGAACRDGKRLACCWCGAVTERSNGGWSVVDACMLFDGSWPDVEHATGGSST